MVNFAENFGYCNGKYQMEGSKDQVARGQQVELFLGGVTYSLSHFFSLHHKALFYFAKRILNDQLAAQEVVSDCFLKLWEKHKDFHTPQHVKAFLFISCRNACLNHLRQMKTRSAAQELYMAELKSGAASDDYQVIEAELLELVSREIDELPVKMREVFKLLYLQGKSTAEVAVELRISVQTVRNQKTKAIEMIKNSLIKKGISITIYLAFLLLVEGI